MPELRKQQRAIEAKLQSLEMTAVDPTRHRLVETLAEFHTRLRARGNVLEVAERQRVVRLLVQEILVSGENITIRHSIPMPAASSNDAVRPSHEPPEPNTGPSYLLRSNSLTTVEHQVTDFSRVLDRVGNSEGDTLRNAQVAEKLAGLLKVLSQETEHVTSPHGTAKVSEAMRRHSCRYSRNDLSWRQREEWRSLRRALASIWRMRSRVRAND